jgi:hypothetical protein
MVVTSGSRWPTRAATVAATAPERAAYRACLRPRCPGRRPCRRHRPGAPAALPVPVRAPTGRYAGTVSPRCSRAITSTARRTWTGRPEHARPVGAGHHGAAAGPGRRQAHPAEAGRAAPALELSQHLTTTLTWLRCPYLADPSPHCQATPTHPSTLPKPSQEPPGRISLGSSAPNHTLLPNSNRAEGTFLPTLPAPPSAPRTSARGARGCGRGAYATRPSRRSSTVKSCGDVDADIAASRLITPSRNRPTRCWSNVCIP